MCSLSNSITILITAFNALQLQQLYSQHIHIIDYYFSSHSLSSSSSYTLLLCIPLSTYYYFPPHLTITPSFLPIYFSVYYFLQDGVTPLHLACLNGHESIVLVLLQNQADPNLQSEVTSRRMMIIIVDGDDDDDSCSSTIRCIFIKQIIIFHHTHHPHPHTPYCSVYQYLHIIISHLISLLPLPSFSSISLCTISYRTIKRLSIQHVRRDMRVLYQYCQRIKQTLTFKIR